MKRHFLRTALGLAVVAVLVAGCGSTVRSTGIRLLYRQAPAPDRVLRDVPYRPQSAHPKHRLDLFLPAGEGWPSLVFVHGGGWDKGDKGLRIDLTDSDAPVLSGAIGVRTHQVGAWFDNIVVLPVNILPVQ